MNSALSVRRWLRRVARAFGLLLLPGLLAACDLQPGLTTELPVDVATGTIYLDTLTVRTSTVLVDSVPTSASGYLMVGQYQDARLGTITGRGYLRLGLGTGVFRPEAGAAFDSLVLVLPTDTYRYGDTTRTQHLEVHRLTETLRPATTYYAFNSRAYAAAPLATKEFRARPALKSVRVRLADALGRELLTAGLNRELGSTAELENRLPGLALTPAADDDAALLRFLATSGSLVLQLFYHYPTQPDEALLYDFTAASGERYFYQLQADRRSSLLRTLTTTRQALPSARTAAETYIEGGLGLQTKVEFPYLTTLRDLGGTWVVNSAVLTLPTVTSTENRYLPPPAALTVQLTDRANGPGNYLASADGTSPLRVPYSRGVSSSTNLEQGLYALSVQAYCEAVLNRTHANYGLLLAPATGLTTPERVVLGATGNAQPPHLGIYLTKIQ